MALAAIQGLYEHSQGQATRIEQVEAENADLEARVAALEVALRDGMVPAQDSQSSIPPWMAVMLAGLGLVGAICRRGVGFGRWRCIHARYDRICTPKVIGT
jgi:hypothetical protein